MPIYVYRPSTARHCPDCAPAFEVLQKIDDAKLEQCPECGAPVQRAVTAPSLSTVSPSLGEANLAKHGFTRYRKVEKGVYEKTTGKGPKVISDKD